jgi:Protein of unknown function (DUF4232)
MIVMTYFSTTARRVAAVAAAAVAGLAISTAAYAATSSGTASTAAASIPRCSASDLGVWLAVGQGNGTAGTTYYPLEFTNLSHHTCYLYGYPGVSALARNGNQLGSPADWGSLRGARIVNVAPGATAHTLLGYHDVLVGTEPGCHQVSSAVELRVYPPGQRSATDAAFSFEVCSHRGPIYMSIQEPIVPGVGTING